MALLIEQVGSDLRYLRITQQQADLAMASQMTVGSVRSTQWERRITLVLFAFTAIGLAEKARRREITGLLRAFQAKDFETINRQAPLLHNALLKAGREEEAWTGTLIHLDMGAHLTELFPHFPLGQQAVALEAGLRACEQAASITSAFGDEACVAFYRCMAGNGYARARRLEEAEDEYRFTLAGGIRMAKGSICFVSLSSSMRRVCPFSSAV